MGKHLGLLLYIWSSDLLQDTNAYTCGRRLLHSHHCVYIPYANSGTVHTIHQKSRVVSSFGKVVMYCMMLQGVYAH